MDEPFGALDPLTRDALGDDYRALHRKLGLTTVMITHDMTEAILLADRIAVMRGGKLLAEGTPSELSASGDAYVDELLRTPRRQAERLRRCCRGMARHELVLRSALERSAGASARLSRQPRAGQRRRAGARTCWSACRWRSCRATGRCCAARCSGLPASCRPCRAWRCSRCSIRCCWRSRAVADAGLGSAFPRSDFCPRCWRSRSIRCCRCCATPSPACAASIPRPRGGAGRRHDAAPVAVDGRIAAGAAGDDGGHPHRGGLGDRHRDAVDADRPDQPRQLHLCRAADPELGVRAVRLPRRGPAGARRSINCWR